MKREKTNFYATGGSSTPDKKALSPTDIGSGGGGGGTMGSGSTPMSQSISSSGVSHGSGSSKERERKESREDKLRKRVSSGGRMPRPSKLDQYKE